MPKFDMGDVGSGVAAPSEMKWVYLNDIVPNERNEKIYTTEIGSLAEDILTHGLLQAPLVHPIGGGKYKIISGHRRVLALKKLAEAGNSEFNKIKVVIDNDTDEISLALKLISANAENRILSNAELLAQTQEYMALLTEYKKKENLPGKVRDMVAKKLNVSTGTVSELLAIGKNLKEPLLAYFKNGFINKTVAVEMSKLDLDQQEELANEIKQNQRQFSVKEIKEMRVLSHISIEKQEEPTSAPEREPSSEPKQETEVEEGYWDPNDEFWNDYPDKPQKETEVEIEWDPNMGWIPMNAKWKKLVQEAIQSGSICNAAPCVICHSGTQCQGCCQKCNLRDHCGSSQCYHGECQKTSHEKDAERERALEGEKGQERAGKGKKERTEIIPQRNYELEVAQVKMRNAITRIVTACEEIRKNGSCNDCPIMQNGHCLVDHPQKGWLSNIYA